MKRLFSRGVTEEPEVFPTWTNTVRLVVALTVFMLVTLPCAGNPGTVIAGVFLIVAMWVALGVTYWLDYRDQKGKS